MPSEDRLVGTPRARQEWANRVRAEYRSAALTAQVLQWSIRFGLPRPLLDTAHRIVTDELDHAELSHACLVALGADQPIDLDQAALAAPDSGDGPLADFLDALLTSYCFGETLAVPLFAAMRQGATLPAARAALDRILRDEAVHRAFGWQALAEVVRIDPLGVGERVSRTLPAVTAQFRHAYGSVPDGAALTPEESAAGLIAPATYREIFGRCLTEDISPRLVRLGLPPAA